MNRDEILDKAKLTLFIKSNSTFIISILFSHRFIWDEDTPTACTDSKNLRLNPTWFCKLPLNQQIGLLLHEAWHVALEHHVLGKDLDPKILNNACDHLINLMLISSGTEIPPNGLCDPKYRGWTEKEIYDDLIQNQQSEPNDWGGDIIKPEEEDESASAALQQHLDQVISKAATQAKMMNDAGSIPGCMQRKLDALFNPKIPWQTVLQNFAFDKCKSEYSYRKPNRRYLAHDLYLPSLTGECLDSINLYTDSSCSVSDRDFAAYRTEMNFIIDVVKPKQITVA